MDGVNVNQARKDYREWNTMNLFRSSYALFPYGDLQKSECPDFLLSTRKGVIGIEVTELKYDRNDSKFNMRAHESWLEDIMLEAQADFEDTCDQKLVVDVHFSNVLGPAVAQPHENESLLLHDGFKESIVKIVKENLPESTGLQFVVDRSSKYGYLNLPSTIEAVYIRNVTGRFTDGLWYAGISTMVTPLSVQSISQRIVDKNAKISHYNKSCAKTWLMIVQNSFLMSAQYDGQQVSRAFSHRYPSRFDKVFIFEKSSGLVTDLHLIKLQ